MENEDIKLDFSIYSELNKNEERVLMRYHTLYICVFFIFLVLACNTKQQYSNKLFVDFENINTGKLTDCETREIWPDAQILCGKKDFLLYKLGIFRHPHFIFQENENHFLKVLIPANSFAKNTGAQWKIPLKPVDEYFFRYNIKFGSGFDFVKGGKLPGLAGGVANSGGNVPNGYDGWSARMMFWERGKLSFYVYAPEQSSKWGERLYFKDESGDTTHISPGVWHEITQHIKMNSTGNANGILQGWFDKKEVFYSDSFIFRKDDNLQIDQIFYSVFMGGDDLTWASDKDEYIYFDNFRISTQMFND